MSVSDPHNPLVLERRKLFKRFHHPLPQFLIEWARRASLRSDQIPIVPAPFDHFASGILDRNFVVLQGEGVVGRFGFGLDVQESTLFGRGPSWKRVEEHGESTW